MTLAAAILAAMLAANAPGRAVGEHVAETEDEGRARYAAIAEAIADVADDEREPVRVATLLVAVSFAESAWRRDVDLGVGPHARGDRGRSCSLYQFHLGAAVDRDGYDCNALLADRTLATRQALKAMRRSARTCRALPPDLALSAFASGRCTAGHEASRVRMRLAKRFEARLRALLAKGGDS